MTTLPEHLLRDLRRLDLDIVLTGKARLCTMMCEPDLYMKSEPHVQWEDPELITIRKDLNEGKAEGFEHHMDGSLRFRRRWCVPKHEELKRKILNKAHGFKYSIHLGSDKMYEDLKLRFW